MPNAKDVHLYWHGNWLIQFFTYINLITSIHHKFHKILLLSLILKDF